MRKNKDIKVLDAFEKYVKIAQDARSKPTKAQSRLVDKAFSNYLETLWGSRK